MAHGADEQRALADESRRVRSALDGLADLAGGKRRRSAAPRVTAIPGLTPENFALPPQASFFPPTRVDPPQTGPAAAPPDGEWFGDDDALAYDGTASAGEVDFNSAPDGPQDTLGMRAASTQVIPGGLADEPAAAHTPEAISDVLDGFEW